MVVANRLGDRKKNGWAVARERKGLRGRNGECHLKGQLEKENSGICRYILNLHLLLPLLFRFKSQCAQLACAVVVQAAVHSLLSSLRPS